jgi:hypothetical protein
MKSTILGFVAATLLAAAPVTHAQCGKVEPGHQGTIPEWPKEPIDFQCERGFSELSLCIINRTGVEWLKNAGKDFVAISDGDAVYAITRDTHPAHPTIVRRGVASDPGSGASGFARTACGYGDKTAFDTLMKQYEEMDSRLMDGVRDRQAQEGKGKQ